MKTEGDSDWVDTSASSAPLRAPFAESHLDGAMVALHLASKGGKRSSGKNKFKGSKGSHDTSVGNDGRPPWIPRPATRRVEITTVETIPSSALLGTSSSVPTFQARSFTVNEVGDFVSFSGVFDQYRIACIEVLIEPQITETISGPSADPGEYITCVDIDDANAPSSLADLAGSTTAVQTRGTQSHYHRWVPGVAVAVYSGAFTSFASTDSMWLDCGSPSIQHYGIKAGSSISGTTGTQSYFLQARFHVMWRARH